MLGTYPCLQPSPDPPGSSVAHLRCRTQGQAKMSVDRLAQRDVGRTCITAIVSSVVAEIVGTHPPCGRVAAIRGSCAPVRELRFLGGRYCGKRPHGDRYRGHCAGRSAASRSPEAVERIAPSRAGRAQEAGFSTRCSAISSTRLARPPSHFQCALLSSMVRRQLEQAETIVFAPLFSTWSIFSLKTW